MAERARSGMAPELVEQFGRLMRANVTSGKTPFRKAWLREVVERVEVDADIIRIVSENVSPEDAVIGAASSAAPGIRSSVCKWRAIQDKTANTYVVEIMR